MNANFKKFFIIFVYALFSSAIDASWQVETIAGTAGKTGKTDAVGSSARFSDITDLAVDSSGNVFVTDSTNQSIREIVYSAGQYNVSTPIPGAGYLLNGITVDSSGNIYFTNSWNHGIVDFTPLEGGGYTGSSFASSGAGFADGTEGFGRFNSPYRIAMTPSGNIYIVDYGNHAIRMMDTSTFETTTIAGANSGIPNGQGYSDGIGTIAQFYNPTGIAVDSYGNIFVVDRHNNAIRKITYDSGTYTVSTIAGANSGTLNGSGYADGLGTAAQFNNPTAIAVDSSGNLYVTDTGNQLIRMLINNSGIYTVSTIAGQLGSAGSSDGDGLTVASFNNPLGIAVNNSGDLYVVDNGSNIVRKLINPSGGGSGGDVSGGDGILVIDVEGSDSAVLSGATTSDTMEKINGGSLDLTSTSNALGLLIIRGGLVSVSSLSNLNGDSSAVEFKATGTDPVSSATNTSTLKIKDTMNTGSLTFDTDGTVQVDSTKVATMNVAPAGTGTMIKTGAGVLEVSSDLSSSTTLSGINVSSGKFYLAGGKAPVAPVDVASGAILQLASGLGAGSVGGATTIESGAEVLLNAGATVPNTGGSDIFSGTLKINSGGKLVLRAGSTWDRDVTIGTAS